MKKLAEMDDARVIEPLIMASSDSDTDVRRTAVESPGSRGAARVTARLIEAMGDSDHEVRMPVMAMLGCPRYLA